MSSSVLDGQRWIEIANLLANLWFIHGSCVYHSDVPAIGTTHDSLALMLQPRPTVGVAPGTITMHLGQPDKRLVVVNPYVSGEMQLGAIDTRAHVRWDLIGLVGGGSMIVALVAGLIASALD